MDKSHIISALGGGINLSHISSIPSHYEGPEYIMDHSQFKEHHFNPRTVILGVPNDIAEVIKKDEKEIPRAIAESMIIPREFIRGHCGLNADFMFNPAWINRLGNSEELISWYRDNLEAVQKESLLGYPKPELIY